jgi:hypothetical protein
MGKLTQYTYIRKVDKMTHLAKRYKDLKSSTTEWEQDVREILAKEFPGIKLASVSPYSVEFYAGTDLYIVWNYGEIRVVVSSIQTREVLERADKVAAWIVSNVYGVEEKKLCT